MFTSWKIFRLFFVFFSLYLLGDIFYRWDGVRYYASFSEFLPSVALIFILWSIVVLIITLLLWLVFNILNIGRSFSELASRTITREHLIIFIALFIISGIAAWYSKQLLFGYGSTLQLKLAVLFCVILTAVFVTWLLRNQDNRIKRWINIVQERITPLVWLFGIFVLVAVPIVTYHAWIKHHYSKVSQKIIQNPVSDRSKPNILLVTFDALTARDMSTYGYHRKTTPFISKWGETASLFTRAKSASNITNPTAASLMTGKRLWTHMTFHTEGAKPAKVDVESLPLIFKKNGYYNIALVVNSYASDETLGIDNSFDIAPPFTEFDLPNSPSGLVYIDRLLYFQFNNKILLYDWFVKEDFIFYYIYIKFLKGFFEDSPSTVFPPKIAFNRFIEILESNPPGPYFAWIHLFPPHYPYLPPEPFLGMFKPSSDLRTLNSQLGLLRLRGDKFDEKKVNVARGRYDEFIRFCDKEFEDFIMKLEIRGKLNNTFIILSSDHGDMFQHNSIGHQVPFLYEQLTHIPLIIKEPGQIKGRVVNDLVAQIDIPATIIDLADIPVPSWMEGRSLVPLLHGDNIPARPIFSASFETNITGSKIERGVIATWEGNYKLIHYIAKNKSQLFNLKNDPDELNDLFGKEPDIGQRLLTVIRDNLNKANNKITKGR
jgi:arylsulfatase A-like enzyme